MLESYKRLEAHGVIGKMMKVDAQGNPVIDPTGEKPGTLIARPFQEFPKVVRRFKADGTSIEVIVGSKKEELRLLAENPDTLDVPLSPLERERNELAQMNADQTKALAAQQDQIAQMMEQIAKLTQRLDKDDAEQVALGKTENAKPSATGKGLEALALKKGT